MLVCITRQVDAQPQKADSLELKQNIRKFDKVLSEIQVISTKIEHEEKVKVTLYERLKKLLNSLGKHEAKDIEAQEAFMKLAIKPDEYQPIIISQRPLVEQRPKTFFGRLFSKDKYRYFKYVFTEDSARIYLGEIKKDK
jgi:hypothetical protein